MWHVQDPYLTKLRIYLLVLVLDTGSKFTDLFYTLV